MTGEAEFQLMLEPGRSLVASACILLTSVLGTKESKEGGCGGRNYAVVDAAMTELLRPALYTAEHLVIPVKEREEGEELIEYDVVGPVCESADKLASNIKLSKLNKGFVACCYLLSWLLFNFRRAPGHHGHRGLRELHGQQLQHEAPGLGAHGQWGPGRDHREKGVI